MDGNAVYAIVFAVVADVVVVFVVDDDDPVGVVVGFYCS